MDARELEQAGFRRWYPLIQNGRVVEDTIEQIPNREGVYVIRLGKPIPRLKGESEILYIGAGKIQDRLYAICARFYGVEYAHTAKDELYRVIQEVAPDCWVSFTITDNHNQLEKDLLHRYSKDHIELPPLNRAGGR